MGFCALGLGFMKEKNNRKMGMGFQFEQHRLGLWDLSWDLKKYSFLGNGIARAQGLYFQISGCECELHNKNACF